MMMTAASYQFETIQSFNFGLVLFTLVLLDQISLMDFRKNIIDAKIICIGIFDIEIFKLIVIQIDSTLDVFEISVI